MKEGTFGLPQIDLMSRSACHATVNRAGRGGAFTGRSMRSRSSRRSTITWPGPGARIVPFAVIRRRAEEATISRIGSQPGVRETAACHPGGTLNDVRSVATVRALPPAATASARVSGSTRRTNRVRRAVVGRSSAGHTVRMKRIALLGATGSIGRQALDVIAANNELELVAASSGSTPIDGLAPLTQVGGDQTELLERTQPDVVLNATLG